VKIGSSDQSRGLNPVVGAALAKMKDLLAKAAILN